MRSIAWSFVGTSRQSTATKSRSGPGHLCRTSRPRRESRKTFAARCQLRKHFRFVGGRRRLRPSNGRASRWSADAGETMPFWRKLLRMRDDRRADPSPSDVKVLKDRIKEMIVTRLGVKEGTRAEDIPDDVPLVGTAY